MFRSRFVASLAALALLTTCLSCAKTLDGDGEDGEGGSGSSSGGSCKSYEDAVGDVILVKFHNNQAGPIYIPTKCNVPDRPFFDLSRGGSEVQIDVPECRGTCGEAQTDADPYCPNFDCDDVGGVIRIDHDKTYVFEWHATEQVNEAMPTSCYDETKTTENECSRKIPLTEDTTIATGEYFTDVDLGNQPCECLLSSDLDGVCDVGPNCIPTGHLPLPNVGVELPSAGEIVFEI